MDASFRPKEMLTMAVATSIDALAVGVSFAFLGMGQGRSSRQRVLLPSPPLCSRQWA